MKEPQGKLKVTTVVQRSDNSGKSTMLMIDLILTDGTGRKFVWCATPFTSELRDVAGCMRGEVTGTNQIDSVTVE